MASGVVKRTRNIIVDFYNQIDYNEEVIQLQSN